MASVNDDIKIFLTYLKTVYVKIESLLGPFSSGNGLFYLKTSWESAKFQDVECSHALKNDADN